MAKPIYNTVTGEYESPGTGNLSLAERIELGQKYGNFGRPSEMHMGKFEDLFGADVEEIQDMFQDGFTPHVERVKERLGEEQSGLSLAAAATYRSIVGELLGGTIENTGYLLDMLTLHDVMANETEGDFGNFLTHIGAGLREHAEDVAPIYGDVNNLRS